MQSACRQLYGQWCGLTSWVNGRSDFWLHGEICTAATARLPAEMAAQLELEAWGRAQAEAHRFSTLAADCQRMIDAGEPAFSAEALLKLRKANKRCRTKIRRSQRGIDEAQDDLAEALDENSNVF